jgi:chromosome segregation ATPase
MFGTKELQKKIEELETSNASNLAQIEELTDKLSGFDDLKNMNAELQKNMATVNGLNEELTSKVSELEEAQSNIETQVSDAALNLVSQIGHEPVAEVADDQANNNMSVSDAYMSIKDPKERFSYYQQNKKQLQNAAFKK